jgi:NAD(P)-dependent dehydrogenase (short-subunit alcohol dehydrogenase family)
MTPILDSFRLQDRVALVTGSTGGLGRAIADALASAGASLVLTSRDQEAASAAADEVTKESGSPALGLALDVREQSQIDEAIAQAMARFGRIDVLVDNAGITHRGPISELSEAQWDEVVDTNLKGAWLCSRSLRPIMREQGWGRILNIASMFGSVALPNRSPYVASKGGMVALTRAMAVEFASDGILVNALAPGPFQTKIADAKARAGLVESIPLQRFGQPHELGPAALFLCSEACSFVTGATLAIDGGYTAR